MVNRVAAGAVWNLRPLRSRQLFRLVVAKKGWTRWLTCLLEHFGQLILRRSCSAMVSDLANRFPHFPQMYS
jgi:hypothetical protein